jgi:hypothetical protein
MCIVLHLFFCGEICAHIEYGIWMLMFILDYWEDEIRDKYEMSLMIQQLFDEP